MIYQSKHQVQKLVYFLPQIGLLVLKKLSQLVTSTNQKIRIRIHVDDKINGFKENSIFGIGVLNFFGFRRFLCFVQNCLQTFCEACANTWVLCTFKNKNKKLLLQQ